MSRARPSRIWLWLVSLVVLLGTLLGLFARDDRPSARASGAPRSIEARPISRSKIAHHVPRSLPMLSGRVIDGTSGSDGAQVCASAQHSDERDHSACVRTTSDGSYAFTQLPEGRYAITASAPGFALSRALDGAYVELQVGAAREHVDIVLRRGEAHVSGVVQDALGGPIAGAHVRVVQTIARKSAVIELATDDDGAFEVWTDRGALMLVAESDGYTPALADVVAPSRGVALTLMPEATVRGLVVSDGDEQPIEGIRVQAIPIEPRLALHRSSVSASDGAFELRGLEPGAYIITADGPRARGALREPVFVQLGQRVDELVIRVAPAVVVSGRVTIGEREPCVDGALGLWPVGGADPRVASSWIAPTDERGDARIEGVPAGRYTVSAQCRNYVQAGEPLALDIGADDVEGLELPMEPGLGLAISARDSAGEPVRGAPIGIVLPARDAAGGRSIMPCTTDATGRCDVPRNLQPGTYTIEALDGYRAEPVSVELRPGDGTAEVALELQGAAYALIAVQTPGGEPIDGVEVTAVAEAGDTAYATALGGGQYRVGPLADGRFEARADDGRSAPISAIQPLDVRAGRDASALIVLDRSAALRGRVLDVRGAPAANTWVSAQHDAATSAPSAITVIGASTRVLTDLDGSFELHGLAPGGAYDVLASAPSGETARQAGVRPGDVALLQLGASEPLADQRAAELEPATPGSSDEP